MNYHHQPQQMILKVLFWSKINYYHQRKQMILKVLFWSKINYHHQPQEMILKVLFWSKIDSKNLTLVNPAWSVLSSLLWWESIL
jgi:hypothetical protein